MSGLCLAEHVCACVGGECVYGAIYVCVCVSVCVFAHIMLMWAFWARMCVGVACVGGGYVTYR